MPTSPVVAKAEPVLDGLWYGGARVAPLWAALNATTMGDNTVVVAVPSKKIRVRGIVFTASASVSVAFKSNATTLIEAMAFSPTGGMAYAPALGGCFLETAAGEALIVNLSTAANVRGSICYELV